MRQGDEIIACLDTQPVWLARRQGKSTCQISIAALPVVREHELLFPQLNEDNFLRLLPLMNFLRQMVKETDWQPASVPACIVMDDPSLYRPSYGHFNFRRLAQQATRHNFFVSVAIIPLDTWYVNREVAETLRSANPRLSAVIHGNNHTACELLVNCDGPASRVLAAQAIRRVERLRERHGLELIKIMEAPHGVMAEAMFPQLLALGFEAALGTTEHLVHYNPAAKWPASFGLERTLLLGGGMPVIPRIRMSANWRNDILLAAFLRQPIVIALHHWDLADGDKFLIELAGLINRLKIATWVSPLGIARSNYTVRRCADELNIKAYSRKFRVSVPSGVKTLRLHRPWIKNGDLEELVIQDGQREILRSATTGLPGAIAVESPCELEVCCAPADQVDPKSVPAPRLRYWPVLRKVLMEARDRSAPVRCWVGKRWRDPATKPQRNNGTR